MPHIKITIVSFIIDSVRLIIAQELNSVIANVQNICNLTGREDYRIVRTILSVSILYTLTKTTKTFEYRGRKK